MKALTSLLTLCTIFFAAAESENQVKTIVRRQAVGGPTSIKGAGGIDVIDSSLTIFLRNVSGQML